MNDTTIQSRSSQDSTSQVEILDEQTFESWLVARLAELEERHSSFVSRNSLVGYFSGNDSQR